MYHQQIVEVVDIRKFYQELEKAGLTDDAEALILAAQEQVLGTRSVKAGVCHTRQDPRCRVCTETSETGVRKCDLLCISCILVYIVKMSS